MKKPTFRPMGGIYNATLNRFLDRHPLDMLKLAARNVH